MTPIEGGRQGTETAVMTEEATIGEIVIEEALGTTEGQRGGITPEVNAEKDIGQMTREEGKLFDLNLKVNSAFIRRRSRSGS